MWNISMGKKMFIFLLVIAGISGIALRDSRTGEPKAIYYAQGSPLQVALTFETLWTDRGVEDILQALNEEGVKATFFVTGNWLKNNHESSAAILAEGHEIGNHTMTHQLLLYSNHDEIIQEISGFNKLCRDNLGYRATLFRPPLGRYNDLIIKSASEEGCLTILWSIDSYDWISGSGEEIETRVIERLHGGAIISFRVGAVHLPAALPRIIKEIQAQGFKPVNLTELLRNEKN